MKKLLLALAVILSLASSAQAQKKLVIVNHTNCEWCITPYMDDPNSAAPPSNFAVGYNLPFATLVGFSTLNFPANSGAGWSYWPSGSSTTFQQGWIWSHVRLAPCSCDDGHNELWIGGPDAGTYTYWSQYVYSNPVSLNTCCGDNTIYWTDLGNGDVQIDIY